MRMEGNIGGFIGFLLKHQRASLGFGLNEIFEVVDNTKSIDDTGDTDSDTKRGEKCTYSWRFKARRAGDGVICAKQQWTLL